ncbi:MAG: GNAT family N-acetyltransferase [Cyanobacteria bacterium P01_E01_bin.45]
MTVHPGNRDRILTRSDSQPDILVYPVSLEELDTLADVLALSFHPRVGLQGLVWPVLRLGIREDIRRRLLGKNPKYCCLGAWSNDELVGTLEIGMRRTSSPSQANYSTDKTRSPYIANLAVLPDWRRKGIASKLLLGAEGIAATWGSDRIFLHVLETNKAAQRLYLNAGYRMQGRSATAWNYFGTPREILLYKSLSE